MRVTAVPTSSYGVRAGREAGGFALIAVISLLVLLALVAVGLLSLSTVTLREASHSQARQIAMSNARLALMLAIGELQKKAGPDQRITAPANLADPSHPMGVTGVWKSWKPDPLAAGNTDYEKQKTGDSFLGYLISDPDVGSDPDPDELPTRGKLITLVGEGSLGRSQDGSRIVEAPIIRTEPASGRRGRGGLAWVSLEENVKARIDLAPHDEARSLAERVTQLGAPARNNLRAVSGLDFLESESPDELRRVLPKFVTLTEVDLKSGTTEVAGPFFHDLSVLSNSVQADVARGGLKTDLSVLFDGEYRDSLPADYDERFVYSDSKDPLLGTNGDPAWPLYANFSRLYRLSSREDGDVSESLIPTVPRRFDSVTKPLAPGVRRIEPEMASVTEPLMLPTVVRIDMLFSLVVRPAHGPWATSSTYPNMLHLMYLPVITVHNPYNIDLQVFNYEVSFEDIPIGFRFLVNNRPTNTGRNLVPLNSLFTGKTERVVKAFSVLLAERLTPSAPPVFEIGPGETRIFGIPFTPTATWQSEVDANGRIMFDWRSNLTGGDDAVRIIPGLMTDPTSGVGFDVDWLAPQPQEWVRTRLGRDGSVVLLRATDQIAVEFGPVFLPQTRGAFKITTRGRVQGSRGRGKTGDLGQTMVYYKDLDTLDALLSEGTSPRFPDPRDFPLSFPDATSPPLLASRLFEANNRRFRDYVRAKPFAIFSVGAKTTQESFTLSRAVADTGQVYHSTFCDYRETESQGSSPLEMALVPTKNGESAIESAGGLGFAFGGQGARFGSSAATLYEVPLAPLQSIAQLRHANAASLGGYPLVTYSVGESRAHPAIPPAAAYDDRGGGNVRLDHAWLANNSLWDRYWFSTLATLEGPAYSGSSSANLREVAEGFVKGERELPNARNRAYFPADRPSDPDSAADGILANEGKSTAAYMLTKGGFNVNSTSLTAWRSVLSALSESEVPIVTGDTVETAAGAVLPRSRRPVHGNSGVSPRDRLWNSYRALDEDEIEELAERIVEHVRERGPFLSLAEFVNRRLEEGDRFSRSGVVQSAIDETAINEVMLANARPVTPGDAGFYDWTNPDAVVGNTGAGAPGEVSQGDVLSAIGSFITVRSDTFRIRCYGDARDAEGRVIARAWCEGTVQRVPDYLDPSDLAEAAPDSGTNENFGRRFRLVAFRWLAEGEV